MEIHRMEIKKAIRPHCLMSYKDLWKVPGYDLTALLQNPETSVWEEYIRKRAVVAYYLFQSKGC